MRPSSRSPDEKSSRLVVLGSLVEFVGGSTFSILELDPIGLSRNESNVKLSFSAMVARRRRVCPHAALISVHSTFWLCKSDEKLFAPKTS